MTASQLNQLAHNRYSLWCKKATDSSVNLAVLTPSEAPPYIATVSDLYPSQIRKGGIQTELGFIERVENRTLYLSNGRQVEVDHLVFATGYG